MGGGSWGVVCEEGVGMGFMALTLGENGEWSPITRARARTRTFTLSRCVSSRARERERDMEKFLHTHTIIHTHTHTHTHTQISFVEGRGRRKQLRGAECVECDRLLLSSAAGKLVYALELQD